MEVNKQNIVRTIFKNCSVHMYSNTPIQHHVRNAQRGEVTKIKNSQQMEVNKQNIVSTIFENCSIHVHSNTLIQHYGCNVQRGKVTKNKNCRQIKEINQNQMTNELPKHRVRNVHRGKVAKNKKRCYRCKSQGHVARYCTAAETERRVSATPALPPPPIEEEAKEEQQHLVQQKQQPNEPIVDTVAQLLGFVKVATVFYKSDPKTML